MAPSFLLVTILSLLGSPEAHSARGNRPAKAKDPNCFVEITYDLNTRDHKERKFSFHRKSRADCEKAAVPFRENFSPQRVKHKRVVARWKP